MNNKTIVVWFSCGAASAVAAKKTIEIYGKENTVRIVNNPIKEEHSDNLRFLKDVEKWLGQEIEFAKNSNFPNASAVEIWSKRKYMSGVHGAPCTTELKKKARQQWEENNDFDFIVLGFTYDEIKRNERFVMTERSNVLPVLIDLRMTKQSCFNYLIASGIRPPEIYELGFSNANCIGCPKATSPTYWNLVRKTFPNIFQERVELSRKLGVKLVRVKGNRVFLDELKETDRGRKLKTMTPSCGIFCEEDIKL